MSRTPILCLAIAIFAGAILAAQGPRFYPDDPLATEPRPLAVTEPQRRALSALLETVNSNLRNEGAASSGRRRAGVAGREHAR